MAPKKTKMEQVYILKYFAKVRKKNTVPMKNPTFSYLI